MAVLILKRDESARLFRKFPDNKKENVLLSLEKSFRIKGLSDGPSFSDRFSLK